MENDASRQHYLSLKSNADAAEKYVSVNNDLPSNNDEDRLHDLIFTYIILLLFNIIS